MRLTTSSSTPPSPQNHLQVPIFSLTTPEASSESRKFHFGLRRHSNLTLNRSESMMSLFYRSLSGFVQEDNAAGLEQFLENKQTQVDDRDENGTTALMLASGKGLQRCVQILLAHGADVNAQDLDAWSPLLCASRGGHTAVVEVLLDAKATLEHRDIGGWTALMWASYRGHYSTVVLLLDNGADVNAHGNFHISSLVWASGRGHSEIVQALISRHANVNMGDKYGTTALVWAARKGHLEICTNLLRAGANVDTAGLYSWTALLVATQGNYFDVVQLLLEHRPNVNALDKDGCTALMIACKEGFYDIATALMAAGAYINIQDRAGDTNLIHAVKGAHRAIVEALLKKYADLDVCGKDRKTAIYTAVEKGNIPIMKLLLNTNPDLEIATKDGDTALLKAVRQRNVEAVQLLLDKRVRVSTTDRKGDTALHIAMRARSKRIVEALLRNPQHSQLLYRPNKCAETPYNIDLAHQKQILGHVFGARRLNTNEDNENLLGYDLYSSALADMLSEPSLSMPITVGLYAKWGSGKSFLLNKLREEMKNFARQWTDPVFDFFSSLLFLIVLHGCAIGGTIVGAATLDWLEGILTALVIFVGIYGLLAIIWLLNERSDFDWPYNFTVNITRKLNAFKLVLQVMFCHPPGSGGPTGSENLQAQPIRFYFTDQTRVSSTAGGENTVVQMLGSLYDAIENNYGAFATRLYRAFRPKTLKNSTTWRLRRLCCIPNVVLFELCFLCCLIGIFALTIYLKQFNGVETQLTLHIVLICVGLLLGVTCVANLYTWGRVLMALVRSQRNQLRRTISRLDTVRSEGFQQALAAEVALLRDMVRCLDALAAQQTRLVVIVDGLDSCEQDKVLLVLDAVHMLFSDLNSPFIVILAIDPHIISKAVEMNSRRLFNESNIGGHDYLRNLVHLPFYLQNSGLRKVKIAQQTAQTHRKQTGNTWTDLAVSGTDGGVLVRSLSGRRLSTDSNLMSSCEKLKPPNSGALAAVAARKGSRKLKLSDSIASSIGSNLNIVVGAHDLTKMLLTDDYFSDVNPRSMRRLMNVVYVTGRLLKAFQVDFNWYHLASWVNITEQWPYRTSWLVLYFEIQDDPQFDDSTSLKTLYDKIRPKIPTQKEIEPLLEMDRDEKKFDIFLSFHRSSLLVADLKIFLPFTINLDPYIKKVIKEEYHQNQQQQQQHQQQNVVLGEEESFPVSLQWAGSPNTGLVHRKSFKHSNRPVLGTLWGPSGPQWSEVPSFVHGGAPLAPVTTLCSEILDTKLSMLNVNGVCQLFDKMEELTPGAEAHYTTAIRKHNISGRVLLHCDLDELKKVLRMNFGDWELFRVLIVALRQQELTAFSRLDEGRFAPATKQPQKTQQATALQRERKLSNPKMNDEMKGANSRGPNNSNNKQSIMEKQVTLEEQMICGALQTLNEEACEDVLELETPTAPVPHTQLIPPSPEGAPAPAGETEFVLLSSGSSSWGVKRWTASTSEAGGSATSSPCSTPRPIHRAFSDVQNSALYPQNTKATRPSTLQTDPIPPPVVPPPPLDSDDESTPLVSDLSTPSVSVGQTSPPQSQRYIPSVNRSPLSSPSPQFSSPEAEHKNGNNLTDSTDFSPISPIQELLKGTSNAAPSTSGPNCMYLMPLSQSGSLESLTSDKRRSMSTTSSGISRQNALDEQIL